MPSTRKTASSGTSSSSATNWRIAVGHAGVDLEPDDDAASALLQRRLEQAHEILGLLLDLEVAVADEAEGALPLDRVAGEELADEQHGDALERDEAGGAGLGEVGQADEAVDLVRACGSAR